MNFYNTKKYHQLMTELNQQIFSKCNLSVPTKEECINDDYVVKHYYYADIENQEPGYAPIDGEICRLFKHGNLIFEWKNIDGCSRMAKIIDHSDGNRYFIFDEDLYGYSVLNLKTMESIHYIPSESHETLEKFEDTFIWCEPYYDKASDLLAVEGCIWGAPYSVIVLNFQSPMRIVEANSWFNLWDLKNKIQQIDFRKWEKDKLRCTSLSVSKKELFDRLTLNR